MKLLRIYHNWIFLLFFLLGIGGSELFAQKKILIKQADEAIYSSEKGKKNEKNTLLGDVIFFHEGAYMYCDSAWYFSESNTLKAFSNVKINQGDTIFLYGDFLDYDGNTRMAIVRGNVKFVDKEMELYTDKLYFDRNNNESYYNTGGKIIDDKNVLVSEIGTYYSDSKWYHFKNDVEVNSPDYIIESDTLHYNTESKVALFLGPSNIYGDSSHIYCENGRYNTVTDIAQFQKNALVRDKNTFLAGDSIYFEQKSGYGQAFLNVRIYDTIEEYVIRGQYGEYLRNPEYAFVTGSPTYNMKTDEDSVHIYGDTLYSELIDSTQTKKITIWPRVKIFKEDLQAKCDSLVYLSLDSTFYLYKDPVVWNDSSQITGKEINLTLVDKKLDSLKVFQDAFVLMIDDFDFHNQVKGRDMFGKFVDNKLKTMLVRGNGQTLYFVREDDKEDDNPPYIGVNHAECSNILIRFNDGEADEVVFIKRPDAKLYRMENTTESQWRLDGFYLRFNERPVDKYDIYPRIKTKPEEAVPLLTDPQKVPDFEIQD